MFICYGDVLFNRYIAQILAESEDPLAVAIDTNWVESANRDRQADYARCSIPHSRDSFSVRVTLASIGAEIAPDQIHGEWMGFLKIGADEIAVVQEVVERMLLDVGRRRAKLPDLLNLLVERGKQVRVLYTTGHWLDIDSLDDVVHAGNF
jgi:phosphoenolpyruvate phosphomutase